MRCLFLSDAHYPISKKISNFLLDVYKGYNRIYILGDLFEFYYGYKRFLYSHHLELINLLRFLSGRVEIVLFEGNHEYRYEQIMDFCNVRVVKLDTVEKIDDFYVYMAHGDTIDKLDISYRLFRGFLKNNLTLNIINSIPPDLLLKMSKIASKISKENLKSKENRRTEQELEQFARKKLNEVDVVIFGHTHKPVFKKFPNGLYINTGDFFDTFSYAEYRDGQFSLKFWGD